MVPAEFNDPEVYSEWSLEHRRGRLKLRLSRSMEKITAFYNSMILLSMVP